MVKQNAKRFNLHRGFTILEVMIAGAVLAIGCLGILGMLTTAQGNNAISADRNKAVIVGEAIVAALDSEARVTTYTAATKKFTGYPTGGVFATIVNKAPTSNKLWIDYGAVSQLGRRLTGVTAMAGEERKFCVGLALRPADGAIYSGAVRVVWRKDGTSFPNANSCSGINYEDFETAAGTANSRSYLFISIPYSFRATTT